MSVSIYPILDKRRAKKDESYPIVFRIIFKRKVSTIPTGYSVTESNWNKVLRKVRKRCKAIPNPDKFNTTLRKLEDLYNQRAMDMISDDKLGDNLSIKQLKVYLTKNSPVKEHDFYSYSQEIIDQLRKEERFGTARSYTESINFVKRHSNDKLLNFNEITPEFLNAMEIKYMSNANNHYNGLAVYMRTIRAILNRAISNEIMPPELYPFSRGTHEINKYKIKRENTMKRAIQKSEIQKIESLANNTTDKFMKKYLFTFLFSFYMRGVNFTDIAYLKNSSIINNSVVFRRSKTHGSFEININEKAWQILNHFGYNKRLPKEYIFPIIKSKDPETIKSNIKNYIRQTNLFLKRATGALEINTKVTTYVARHSWATIADKSGINRNIISKGLGHSDLKTTDIYINDIVSSDELRKADDIITS